MWWLGVCAVSWGLALGLAGIGVFAAWPFLMDARAPLRPRLYRWVIQGQPWLRRLVAYRFWLRVLQLACFWAELVLQPDTAWTSRALVHLLNVFWFQVACKLYNLALVDLEELPNSCDDADASVLASGGVRVDPKSREKSPPAQAGRSLMELETRWIRMRLRSWKPPSLRPWHLPMRIYNLAGVRWFGLENVTAVAPAEKKDEDEDPDSTARPGRPYMFVMNHAIWGLEMPYFVYALFHRTGICVRALADHVHWTVPGWGDFLDYAGAVDGTPENCNLVLGELGQDVLVFPGGTPEVFKSASDTPYGLKWKERLGFARAAIRHGCTVVPANSYGTEDMFRIVGKLPGGERFLGRGPEGPSVPVIRPPGLGGLQRVYFRLGRPIPTHKMGGRDTEDNAREIRDKVKQAVEEGIEFCRRFQATDPHRFSLDRWGLGRLRRGGGGGGGSAKSNTSITKSSKNSNNSENTKNAHDGAFDGQKQAVGDGGNQSQAKQQSVLRLRQKPDHHNIHQHKQHPQHLENQSSTHQFPANQQKAKASALRDHPSHPNHSHHQKPPLAPKPRPSSEAEEKQLDSQGAADTSGDASEVNLDDLSLIRHLPLENQAELLRLRRRSQSRGGGGKGVEVVRQDAESEEDLGGW